MGKFRKPTKKEYSQSKGPAEMDALMRGMDAMVSALMPSVYNNAIELTKLIIENRNLKNNGDLDDDDIYEIHRESFRNCMPDKIDPKYDDYGDEDDEDDEEYLSS